METTKEHQGEERMRNGGATRPSPRLRESWRWIMFPALAFTFTYSIRMLLSLLTSEMLCYVMYPFLLLLCHSPPE